MQRSFFILLALSLCVAHAFGQTGEDRFPGLSPAHLKQLREAKRSVQFPLPTWLPAGFKAEKVEMKLGPRVPIDEKVLTVIYSKKLPNGKVQRFAIEAGFDGLGGLPYDVTNAISSPVGKIDLMYEPKDLDNEAAKLKNFAMTEWFRVGRTDFHYDGMYGSREDDPNNAMLPLADTLKILRSLKRF